MKIILVLLWVSLVHLWSAKGNGGNYFHYIQKLSFIEESLLKTNKQKQLSFIWITSSVNYDFIYLKPEWEKQSLNYNQFVLYKSSLVNIMSWIVSLQNSCWSPNSQFHRLGNLEKYLLSQFWKQKVWEQGVGRHGFFWDVPPWLLGGCHLMFLHDLPSV